MTWEKGRQLKSFDSNTYTYNANGIRTSKTVAGVKHDYLLDGTKILCEGWNYDETSKTYQDILIPLYDNEDSVCGIIYNGEPYYFQKNLQGDIVAITNKSGKVIGRYSYDAWGVPTIVKDDSACSITTINPFRYRGYYFDKEIGMYYLQSRYYDSNVGRFVSADAVPQIGFTNTDVTTNNILAYCINTPVNMYDNDGYFPITINIMSAIIGAFNGAYIGAAVAAHFGFKGWKRKLCVVGGSVLMGLVGWFFPLGTLYAAVKAILFSAGYAYLSSKGYSIAAMTYSHGMWGAGRSLPTQDQQKIINKVKSCQEYKSVRASLINRINKGETAPYHDMEFTKDADMYYAIQHMRMIMRYDKTRKKYKVNMSDTYNFDKWRRIFTKSGASFANAANNLGLMMQKCGMMIPYKIDLSFYA